MIALRDKFASLSTYRNNLSPDDPNNPTNIAKELIQVISTSVAYSVIMSIGHYDSMLKDNLEKDFAAVADVISKIESDVMVLQMKVGDLENGSVTSEIPKE